MARDLLIPDDVWEQEKGELFSSMREEDVSDLAEQWHISPAVVAGRMRLELNDYSILTGLLGHKILKKMFMTANNE